MLTDLDHGTRCTEHVGEVFRVRCSDCDAAAAESYTRSKPIGVCSRGHALIAVSGGGIPFCAYGCPEERSE